MTYTSQIKVLIIALFHTEDYTVLTIYIVYLRKYVLILKYYKKLGKGGLQRQLVAVGAPRRLPMWFRGLWILKYQNFNKWSSL